MGLQILFLSKYLTVGHKYHIPGNWNIIWIKLFKVERTWRVWNSLLVTLKCSSEGAHRGSYRLRGESPTPNYLPIMTTKAARNLAARHIMRIVIKVPMVSKRINLEKSIKKQNCRLTSLVHQKSYRLTYHTHWSSVDDSYRNENLL